MIDLHVHTTASDGSYSPLEVVQLAARMNLTHLAITDHDTVAAVEETARHCDVYGITLIPAIELSSIYHGVSVDILGYGIDPTSPMLLNTLKRLAITRQERIAHMVKRLQEAGFPIELSDVQQAAADGVWGRPHIARALVNLGLVDTIKEAFERYIGKGKPAYIPKESLSSYDAIGLIAQVGGIAVLAHPRFLKMGEDDFQSMLRDLVGTGLGGIEVYYSQHSLEDVRRYEGLAKAFGLIVTGGSDFHGKNKPDIALGEGPLGQPIEARIATDLIRAIETFRKAKEA